MYVYCEKAPEAYIIIIIINIIIVLNFIFVHLVCLRDQLVLVKAMNIISRAPIVHNIIMGIV